MTLEADITGHPRVAVIGAGVAGLSAAYHLRHVAAVTLFERDGRVGGHANTVVVDDAGTEIGVDTAFVVFNGRTYPLLSEWFAELGVAGKDHTGGFNFFDLDTGVQYGTSEFSLTLEQVRERYPTDFVEIWEQAKRFYAETPRDFMRGRANMSLGDYLDTNGYSTAFKSSFVVLLATAVWSIPHQLIWEMPATTFIAFFMSHDPGGLGGLEVAWKTVADGSRSYVKRALEEIGGDVRLNCEVSGVREVDGGVEVSTTAGTETFDAVVLAAHADQTLAILDSPTAAQTAILEKVRYSSSYAIVHTDPSVLPEDRSRWQSWNYGRTVRDGHEHAYVVYFMNRLQGFEASREYFVSIGYPGELDPAEVIEEIPYSHPIIDMAVRDMQKGIYAVNRGARIALCGSYFHAPKIGPDLIGSHEAAYSSGREAARSIEELLGAVATSAAA